MNDAEMAAAEKLWESYPNFKRPIIPSEFIDVFEARVKEKGCTSVRIEGKLDPFYTEFEAKVTIVERREWTRDSGKYYDFSVASFRLEHLPGCGGILLSNNSWVNLAHRGKGVGSLMQEMKMWIANKLEAGVLLATVIVGNEAEEALLGKHGWKTVGPSFRNVHTENDVRMWQRILT
ncbi:hypothetical protein LCGC14_2228280 [marine sediment metagenome]|uniref:N-acetyltransferase domain-containing protein n=1 Tax=marine sediment metagenome TaxID=412755 RepID=A0A0F9G497_9ZZZZ